ATDRTARRRGPARAARRAVGRRGRDLRGARARVGRRAPAGRLPGVRGRRPGVPGARRARAARTRRLLGGGGPARGRGGRRDGRHHPHHPAPARPPQDAGRDRRRARRRLREHVARARGRRGARADHRTTGRAGRPSAAARLGPRHRLGALTPVTAPASRTHLTPPRHHSWSFVMPTFPAPHPVTVAVDVPFAHLHVVAGERDDVVVTVLPTDPARSSSVRAAEAVRVDSDGAAVTISFPGTWKQYVLPFASGTADITVELPAGSDVRGKAGSIYAEGALGAVDMALSAGDARVEDVERLDVKASAGSVAARRVSGSLDARASAGSVRVEEVRGEGSIKATNGTTTVGVVTGSLAVHGAHGD